MSGIQRCAYTKSDHTARMSAFHTKKQITVHYHHKGPATDLAQSKEEMTKTSSGIGNAACICSELNAT